MSKTTTPLSRLASRLVVACGLWLALSGHQAKAIEIVFDYRFDTNNFFGPTQRSTLEAAASFLEGIIVDDLLSIEPSGGNTWSAYFFRPDTGALDSLDNLTIASDSLLIFVGSKDNGVNGTLGEGGVGGLSVSGTSSWNNRVIRRGEDIHGVITPSTPGDDTETAPWGGTLSFNDNTGVDWHYEVASPPPIGQYDFYSVALHELGHVLGFSIADSFDALVNGSFEFTGLNAVAANGGNVALESSSDFHWQSNTFSTVYGTGDSQDALFNPTINNGERLLYTELDVAALDDIGWEIIPEPGSALLFAIGGCLLMLRRPRRA